jgi:dihydropyrimidinase
MTVTGLASHTISQGVVVYANGTLCAERGKGRYVKRPAFHPMFDALAKASARQQFARVERPGTPS